MRASNIPVTVIKLAVAGAAEEGGDAQHGEKLAMKQRAPIHPGEILREELLVPLGISQSRLARENVPPRRINEICLGKRAITPNTALRLSALAATAFISIRYFDSVRRLLASRCLNMDHPSCLAKSIIDSYDQIRSRISSGFVPNEGIN